MALQPVRDFSGDRNVPYFGYIKVNLLAVILDYTVQNITIGESRVEGIWNHSVHFPTNACEFIITSNFKTILCLGCSSACALHA